VQHCSAKVSLNFLLITLETKEKTTDEFYSMVQEIRGRSIKKRKYAKSIVPANS
jgi:hypothetical protein